MAEAPAFSPDVFTWPSDSPRLIAGRCGDCGAVAFPQPPSCARCGSTDVDRHLLPRRGTLWTWTTQEFLPKEPYASGETAETFQPYGVGMIELPGEVRVESRLTTMEGLEIGMAMELTVIPFGAVVIHAFAPAAEQ